MNDQNNIDLTLAYKKTLKGILITFLLCNSLIFVAVLLGFIYTINKIDKTAENINSKIDKSYESTAEVGRKVIEKVQAVGANLENSVKTDIGDMKDKSKEMMREFLRSKMTSEAKVGQSATGSKP